MSHQSEARADRRAGKASTRACERRGHEEKNDDQGNVWCMRCGKFLRRGSR